MTHFALSKSAARPGRALRTALEACRVVECRPAARRLTRVDHLSPGRRRRRFTSAVASVPPLVARDVTVRLLDPRPNEWMEENDER